MKTDCIDGLLFATYGGTGTYLLIREGLQDHSKFLLGLASLLALVTLVEAGRRFYGASKDYLTNYGYYRSRT